jgi:hypothetical protein
MTSATICLRNAKRSGSTPLEYYLEQAGITIKRAPRGWKHGPAPSPNLPHGGHLPPDAHPIILSKHPLAWLRSRTLWDLPNPDATISGRLLTTALTLTKTLATPHSSHLPQLLYSAKIESWVRGYAGWFDALPRWLHVRHIDLLRHPSQEWARICDYLNLPTTELSLSDQQINPGGQHGRSKGPTNDPFDPTYYTNAEWQSWFSADERAWIAKFISDHNLSPLINGMGYYLDPDHDALFAKPSPAYLSRSQSLQ